MTHVKPWLLSILGGMMVLMGAGASEAQLRLKVVRSDIASGTNLLVNPGFEQAEGQLAQGWNFWQAGYRLAAGEGRNASAAVTCVRQAEEAQYGASQTVTLNQPRAMPIIVRGWSKAQDVSGTADRDYALYCDLIYTDGSPLWGQITPFSVGTHDWQQREVMIIPAQPVRSITVHCLFRGNHQGQVWFDDVELFEMKAAAGTVLLDGVAVVAEKQSIPPATTQQGGGMRLQYDPASGGVSAVFVGERRLSAVGEVGGFLVRDVAANSDFIGFREGQCEELGLQLEVTWTETPEALRLSGRLRDLRSEDRAVTLLFALPVNARGGEWGRNIRGGRRIEETGEYAETVAMGTGATGTMAQYPFSCIYRDGWGLGLGIDLNRPCQYRLAYNADLQQYFAAFDFALVPDTEAFPSAAPFSLVLYAVDPAWGFRSAAERYYRIFPESFVCRSKQQGIWMPFAKISEVEGWEDFGFRYKEGNNETEWDDQHDILTFRYTEPSTWWMPMPEDMPRTYEVAMALAQQIADGTAQGDQMKAKALFTSGLFDEQGRYVMRFLDTPWCNGAVFSMSCLPGLKGEVIDARINWNDEQKARLYGAQRKGDLDGEYLDSLEGYVTSDMNFRREHFAVANRPLTFTRLDHRPVIHKGLAVDEFVEWIADDVHKMGKLMMANSVPYRFTFLVGNLDVMGTETDWLRGGKWQPMGHDHLSLIRTMCAQKPYLFLMNTDFEALGPYVERYFQRSLFYGMYPSMFSPTASSQSHYWQTPKWYNRDRALHKHYQLIIRHVAEAGWQPITLARTDTAGVLLERFGPNEAGEVFITVFNNSEREQMAAVTVAKELVKAGAKATELVSGKTLALRPVGAGQRFEVALQPEECAAVRLGM